MFEYRRLYEISKYLIIRDFEDQDNVGDMVDQKDLRFGFGTSVNQLKTTILS